jgi:streptogrisin C
MTSTKMPGAGFKRILALGAAAGVALATALAAVPASAVPASAVPPAVPPAAATEEPTASGVGAGGAGVRAPGLSGDGLAEAVLRDLGLTPEEFAAAGQLGKQAADASAALRDVPGYIGTRLQNGRILVTGSGPELEARVGELRSTVPAVELEVPAAEAEISAEAAESAVPSVPRSGKELARSTQQLYQAYLREVGPDGLQAVAYSGGRFVIRAGGVNAPEATPPDSTGSNGPTSNGPTSEGTTSEAAGKISPAEFVARYANVVLDDGAALALEADVVGGQGYFADTGEICSTGFSAFDPAGLPSVLTAGHCSDDGAAHQATLEFPQWNPAGLLGTFGFSQFGGPGNSTITGNAGNPANPQNVGTDVAVIGSIRAGLDPEPAASTWNDASQAGPDVKIIGTAAPVVGQPVCRSGRTSAWSCGTIDEVGIYVVQGRSADPADLRAFTGFLSFEVQSSGGDSGGPWLSGNYAVGIHSAGDVPDPLGNVRNFAIAANLDDAMAVLPGYQLELFLNKPVVTSPASGGTFEDGQTIAGHVPAAPATAVAAGSKVRITVSGQAPLEVPVDAAGNWSFTAPETTGALRFSAETFNGFSDSGASAFEFAPAAAGPPAQQTPAQQTPGQQAPEPAEPAGTPPASAPPPAPIPPPTVPVPPPAAADPPWDAAVLPSGDLTAVGPPTAYLANTGASGIMTAAGVAAGAIAVGALLMALVRRRKRRASKQES